MWDLSNNDSVLTITYSNNLVYSFDVLELNSNKLTLSILEENFPGNFIESIAY